MKVKVRVRLQSGKLVDYIINSSSLKYDDVVEWNPESNRYEPLSIARMRNENITYPDPRDRKNFIH